MARTSVAEPKRPHRAGTDEVGVRHVSDRGNPRPLADHAPLSQAEGNQFPHKVYDFLTQSWSQQQQSRRLRSQMRTPLPPAVGPCSRRRCVAARVRACVQLCW